MSDKILFLFWHNGNWGIEECTWQIQWDSLLAMRPKAVMWPKAIMRRHRPWLHLRLASDAGHAGSAAVFCGGAAHAWQGALETAATTSGSDMEC